MIVSDDDVSAVLAYLSIGGAATAEAAYLAAERARKRREAEVYLSVKGAVEERKARVWMDNEFGEKQAEADEAKAELTKAKAMERHADKVCDIWRTENANVRAAEKIR